MIYLWNITMIKTSPAYSRYGRDAALMLGQLIRLARIDRKLTQEQLAERADVSRGLVHRIEKGDLGCAIGAVFEVAAIVGVRLFDADQSRLANGIAANPATLELLTQAVRTSIKPFNDDF
jgi:DNA-binding XRE family transcriptional regulator